MVDKKINKISSLELTVSCYYNHQLLQSSFCLADDCNNMKLSVLSLMFCYFFSSTILWEIYIIFISLKNENIYRYVVISFIKVFYVDSYCAVVYRIVH